MKHKTMTLQFYVYWMKQKKSRQKNILDIPAHGINHFSRQHVIKNTHKQITDYSVEDRSTCGRYKKMILSQIREGG